MTSQEVKKIINNLKSGKRYEFSNQYDGIREVMEYNKSIDRFFLTTYYAYGNRDKETADYSEDKMSELLEGYFAYKDFKD
ncbi:MAG: hypothetical protein JXJ04_04320 [Spirochaetales bacterium]|nr:hypothetical protein [Spirochaetales bacterium]